VLVFGVPLYEEAVTSAVQGKYGPSAGVGRRLTETLVKVYYEAGRIDEAVATHEKLAGIVTSLRFPGDFDSFARTFATSPLKELRNGPRAVELASKAVELAPTNGAFWNTSGVAQYRVGNYKAAIEALNKSMELRKGGDATDWFFVAMAEWQLGNKPTAYRRYAEAVQWMEMKAPTNAEMIRFRSEAAELLGLTILPNTRPTTRHLSSPAAIESATRPTTTPAR
jgi:tetratricopeptide (TPR) repeat protein